MPRARRLQFLAIPRDSQSPHRSSGKLPRAQRGASVCWPWVSSTDRCNTSILHPGTVFVATVAAMCMGTHRPPSYDLGGEKRVHVHESPRSKGLHRSVSFFALLPQEVLFPRCIGPWHEHQSMSGNGHY